jgi:hypothetical protein
MRAISAAILLVLSSQVATEQALRPVLDFAGDEVRLRPSATPTKVTGLIARSREAAVARGLPQPRKTTR